CFHEEGSTHTDTRRVLRRIGAATPTTPLAKLRVLPYPCLGHDHDVLKLQVVFEFRLVFGRDAAVFGAFDQLGNALLDAIGRIECDYGLRSGTCRDEINNFLVRFSDAHHLSIPYVEWPCINSTLQAYRQTRLPSGSRSG